MPKRSAFFWIHGITGTNKYLLYINKNYVCMCREGEKERNSHITYSQLFEITQKYNADAK